MFFNKKITREPELCDNAYRTREFKHCYVINEESGIMNAYRRACELSKDEAEGCDGINILLSKELYELEETLALDGLANSELPIIFSSACGSKISGGKGFIGGFTEHGNGVFKKELPDCIGFRQLYANGELCIRSRYPKKSDNFKNEYVEGKWLSKERAIELPISVCEKGETDCLEIIAIEKWTCSVAKIKRIEHENGKAIFYLDDESASLFFDENRSTRLDKPLCRIENSLELLTDENEWFFDRGARTLYFKPSKNADINSIEFTAPVCERLIEIRHSGVYFKGISFCHSNWDYPSLHGFAEQQGTRYIDKASKSGFSAPPAAISVYSRDVHFDSCKIFGTGGAGIALYGDSTSFSISGCTLHTIGAGAISVGVFDESESAQRNIVISNNMINGVGRSYLGGVAILAGYTKNLTIDRNTINDCGYTGISVGWGWGKPNDMGGFKITNNRVCNIINNYLFDGAGLYLMGRQSSDEENIIIGNYLEGGNGYAGLYFDEFANNYIARDNIIMAGKKNGWFLLMHDVDYGLHSITVENNIIETKKKFINSYRYIKDGTRPYFKRSKPKKRGVFVRNNYTAKSNDFPRIREIIYQHSGAIISD